MEPCRSHARAGGQVLRVGDVLEVDAFVHESEGGIWAHNWARSGEDWRLVDPKKPRLWKSLGPKKK